MRRFFVTFAALMFSGIAAYSYTNILENGTNQVILTDWDAAGDMVVGDATSSNSLSIVSGGSLTNANAYVGRQAGSSDNSATVSGTGSQWINSGSLQVGVAGNSNNTVSVSEGGRIIAGDLVIQAGNDFSLNRNGTLELASGFDVSTAGFNWKAGGTLSVGGALTGLATTNEGVFLSGEKALILNGGSLDTTNALIVGYESSNNSLVITNGATASSADGYIGWGATSGDNAVRVSDAGSAWTNSGSLYVGVYGEATNRLTTAMGNSLTVTNEAWVFVGGLDTNLTALGSGGIAVASGAEMVVGTGASVESDGLYIDAAGAFDLYGSLTINNRFDADQTGFSWKNGGTLTVHSNLTLNANLSGTDRTLNVDGGSWNRGASLAIDGSGNMLAIVNGGTVTNDAADITGSNNTVSISGVGSHWLNNGELNIASNDNSVSVSSGGRVTADALTIADDNAFNLNDGGTLAMTGGFDLSVQSNLNWNAGGNLSIGGVLEGMSVATNLSVADATYLGGRRALTLDGGSWLVGDNNLIVGLNDGGVEDLNHLSLLSGARVDNANGYVGWGTSGDQNSVVVGNGAAWTNHGGGLYVGKWHDANTNRVDAGRDNSLTVEDGGWVFVGDNGSAGLPGGVTGGLVVASTHGAELVVGGNGSSVTVEQGLYVGVDASTTGTVFVSEGGTVAAGELVIAANSTVDLYGSLTVATNFNAGQNGFNWYDDASLSVGGTLTGLSALGGTNRALTIDGGFWDTTTTDLYITGTGNTFAITNGGTVDSASAYIGFTSNDVDNAVFVSGDGSTWNVAGDLSVHAENTLELASNGLVSIAGDMSVNDARVAGSGTVQFNGDANTLSIMGPDSQISTNVLFDGGAGADILAFADNELVVAGSLADRFAGFETLQMTGSQLAGSGTVDVFDTINVSGGTIAPDGELVIDGALAVSDTILQLTAGEDILHVTNSGALNLSGLSTEVTIGNQTTPAGFNAQILTSADGFAGDAFDSTNFVEHFLLYDFLLTNDTTTVSAVSEVALDGEIAPTVEYGGVQGIRASFKGMQSALFVRTKQLRRNHVATDHAVSNEAYLISPTNAPSGPMGPGDRNTIFGMHFWAQQFSGQGDYEPMGMADGFSLNYNGTTFGFDKLFGDALVVGINYTYARTAARATGDDQVDTETYWVGLYGEWFGTDDYYVEGLLGLGWSDYNTVRTDIGYRGIGVFEGSNLGAHIESGKYFHHNNWAMAPYVGLQYLGIHSDAYTEMPEGGGPPVAVSDQSVSSLESALGIKLRNRFDTRVGRFQTAGYVEWLYDFINEDIGSTLSDGTISVETARITPGASLISTGVGLSWICTDYLEVGIGYDAHFNEEYEEHTGSLLLDIRF